MTKQPENGAPERRESVYPYTSLSRALELAKAVLEYGGDRTEVARSLAAEQLGMDEAGQTFVQLVSSARSYRLIEAGKGLTLTPLAKSYYFPRDESEQRLAALGFIGAAPAFRFILDRFDGRPLPETEKIANALIHESLVGKSWAVRVTQLFQSACKSLGVIDDAGHLRYRAAIHRIEHEQKKNAGQTVTAHHTEACELADDQAPIIQPKHSQSQTPNRAPAAEITQTANIQPGRNVWVWTEAGGTVRVETPDPLPRALWQRLGKYVEMLAPPEESAS